MYRWQTAEIESDKLDEMNEKSRASAFTGTHNTSFFFYSTLEKENCLRMKSIKKPFESNATCLR